MKSQSQPARPARVTGGQSAAVGASRPLAGAGGAGSDPNPEFASGVLSVWEVLAQSVANIAPTFGVALTVALVSGVSGTAAWLTWLIATVIFLLVGTCVVVFSRRIASSGSLYTFVTLGVGPRTGFVVGTSWLAIVATGPVLVLVFGNYANALIADLGMSSPSGLGALPVYLIGTITAAYVSFRGVKLSTTLLLIIEVASMALIALLVLLVILQQDSVFDASQLTLEGVSAQTVLAGVVLAAFAFGGFESAASLALEAKDPRRQVPQAVLGSVALVGMFFIFNAYGQAYGFQGHGDLAESSAPLGDLADFAGVSALGPLVDVAVLLSAWCCILANFNHGSRLVFTMAKNRLMPRVFGQAHREYRSPHVAILAFCVLWCAWLSVIAVTAGDANDWIGWLGTFQGYMFIAGYLLVAFAAPVFLIRFTRATAGFKAVVTVAAGVAIFALVTVLYQSITPLPERPYDIVLAASVAVVLASGLYMAIAATRDRGIVARVQANARDVESE